MGERLGLAEAISSLRAELYEAMTEGAGKAVQFNVGGVDLEFQVEVGREGGGGGKIRVWVVEAGAEGTVRSASTQTIKIHLDPVDSITKTQVTVAETAVPQQRTPADPQGSGGPSVATG